MTVFASLAKKNFDSAGTFWVLEVPRSEEGGLNVDGLNDTVGRLGISLSMPPIPSPPLDTEGF